MIPFSKQYDGSRFSLYQKKPDPNTTAAKLTAQHSLVLLPFSRVTLGASIYLLSLGNQTWASDIPSSLNGYLIGFQLWDGTTLRSVIDPTPGVIKSNYEIHIYMQNTGMNFTAKARINGITACSISNCPHNKTYYATIETRMRISAS